MMGEKIILDGLWDFFFENDGRIKLPVPGCFDTFPAYRCKRGKGTYSRMVDCSGMTELTLDGLGLRAEFFWDGKKIGSELTAYTPVKLHFDAGTPGEHELKIVCDNTIENTPESEFRGFYDFYGFGGIYREISLRQLPPTYFEYVRLIPEINEGAIHLHVEMSGPDRETEVRVDGAVCGVLTGSGDKAFRVPSPELWSPDSPILHHLQLDCGNERYECRFGLRKIEVHSGGIYLNGQRLKIVGINRHDVFPDTGAAVAKEQLRGDLTMIKNAGVNMIRGAHYPQSQAMLDLADELGILVWDETLGWENPLESLTYPGFQRRQCDGLTRMIKTSINHPSIVFWGFLNEAATNDPAARTCVSKFYRTVKDLDPSRLVTYASMHGEKDRCLDLVDVISFNTYPGWYGGNHAFFEKQLVADQLKKLISFVQTDPTLSGKPVLISEIGAAALIGDHSERRWSEEYQAKLIECAVSYALEDPDCSGILLWQFCNSPVDDNERIMMRPRGYNNKGLVDEYRKPKLAWKRFPGLLEKYKEIIHL